MANNKICAACNGSGWLAHEGTCSACGGSGVVETPRYPGWAGVCSSFDPEVDPIEVHGDTPLIDEDFVLALTPQLADDATWREREAAATVANETAAAALYDSWLFVEKPLRYEPDGDVIWA